MSSKRIVFIGVEETGWCCLDALVRLGAAPAAVFTLDETIARQAAGFRSFAEFQRRGVPIHFVEDINAPATIAHIRELAPDLIYQVGWSQMLSGELLGIAPDGCVGMHGSLLPKHRGRAVIPWSIILGLRVSGMTLFYLAEDADRGDIIGQEPFPIGPDDSATEVYRRSVEAAVALMRRYHPLLERGVAPRIVPDSRRSDYWRVRTPQDGLIDWDCSARHLYDWVRALTHPFPGAFTFWKDRKLFVWRAAPAANAADAASGRVVLVEPSKGVLVGSGEGALWLTSLQLDGEEELQACEFTSRYGLTSGDCFA